MTSPFASDAEMIRASGLMQSLHVRILADRLKLRRQQIDQARAILLHEDTDAALRVDLARRALDIDNL